MKHTFQVDLGGMIDILGNHLYSEEKVFIRELIQNGVDAIQMRKNSENIQGHIHFEIFEDDQHPQICIEDNGQGLTEDEIHQFLAKIGSSLKRNQKKIDFERNDYIGQFGIGILSCFMVTDEIVLITQSAKGGDALEWHGKNDGTYTLKKIKQKIKTGTKVYLKAKEPSSFFEIDSLTEIVRHYGQFLPTTLSVGTKSNKINAEINPFANNTPKEKLLELGAKHFEIDFFDAVPLYNPDNSNAGVAYILPYSTGISSKKNHLIYLKNMLVVESGASILPDWAVFAYCIINTNTLKPTASRESFYEDDNLMQTKEYFGEQLKSYLKELSKHSPEKLNKLISIHHNPIKMLAIENEDFFRLMINFIEFPSTLGYITLPAFFESQKYIDFVDNVDEFRQLIPIAIAQNKHLINAGYAYCIELLEKVSVCFPEWPVRSVSANDMIQIFEELSLEERNEFFDFVDLGNETLLPYNCTFQLKKFAPDDIPCLFHINDQMKILRDMQETEEDTPWKNIMDNLSKEIEPVAIAQLVLNYNNSLVQKLTRQKKAELTKTFIKILYVQSLMMGHHPITKKELNIIGESMVRLIDLKS